MKRAVVMNTKCLLFLLVILHVHSSNGTEQERKRKYRLLLLSQQQNRTFTEPCDCQQTPVRNAQLPVYTYAEDNPPAFPDGALDTAFCRFECGGSSTLDFDVMLLVRMIYSTRDDALRRDIIRRLQDLYNQGELMFWIQKSPMIGERKTRNTFTTSENHIIINLSNALLLQPLLDLSTFVYDESSAAQMHQRFFHFCQLKQKYGFYEYFSTNYLPFTAGALLNLIDFADHVDVRISARRVMDRLIQEYLMVTTARGYFYPAAGRNFVDNYREAEFRDIPWFALGVGTAPTGDRLGDAGSTIMAMSSYSFSEIAWNTIENKVVTIGHGAENSETIHTVLDSAIDRTIFQWAAGGYVVPATVEDSVRLIQGDYGIRLVGDSHVENSLNLPMTVRLIASLIPAQTRGSDLAGPLDIAIFKNDGVALTSIQKSPLAGARSAQQWTWAATVHDIAIWTQAGVVGPSMSSGIGALAETHMPSVHQDGNVAVIGYRPAFFSKLPSHVLRSLPVIQHLVHDVSMVKEQFAEILSTQVALNFPLARFDEVTDLGNWIAGQKQDSYIAVWRPTGFQVNNCTDFVDDECDEFFYFQPGHGDKIQDQTWVVVVGNNDTHGNFSAFVSMVQSAHVKTKVKPTIFGKNFEAVANVDGKVVSVRLNGKVKPL